jgi:hypothetical protein
MSHRIARICAPLLRLLGRLARKGSRAVLDGPTVHQVGVHTPKETAPLVAVPGVGAGSCGIPASCMVITR